jgi:hypothetical protein
VLALGAICAAVMAKGELAKAKVQVDAEGAR